MEVFQASESLLMLPELKQIIILILYSNEGEVFLQSIFVFWKFNLLLCDTLDLKLVTVSAGKPSFCSMSEPFYSLWFDVFMKAWELGVLNYIVRYFLHAIFSEGNIKSYSTAV